MNHNFPILRVFNKNYNNAIPYAIRKELGFESGDLLSYSVTDAGDVLIHKIPIEDRLTSESSVDCGAEPDDMVIRLFNSLSPDQRASAISYLTVRFKPKKAKKGKKTT